MKHLLDFITLAIFVICAYATADYCYHSLKIQATDNVTLAKRVSSF